MAKQYKYRQTFTYNGKKYDVKADSRAELARKIADKMAALDAQSGPTSTALFKDYAVFVFETYKRPTVKENTYKKYLQRLNHNIIEKLGYMRIADIKRVNCQQVLNELQGQSAYQIKQTRQYMQFIFKQAMLDGLITSNPAEALIEPKGTKSTRRSLDDKERALFLEACALDPRFNIFLLSYYCGLRPEEARNVKGADITDIDGVKMLYVRGTKNDASTRFVPLADELYNLIKNTPKTALIAPNSAGNHHTDKSYKRAWDNLLRNMNILAGCEMYRNQLIPPYPVAPDLVPYCLRHTFCTDLQKKGVDIRTAQKLMGHSDISMTANIYTHVDASQILEAARIMATQKP